MDGGDDDDGDANEQFERKGIDDLKPLGTVLGLLSRDFGLRPLCFVLCSPSLLERFERALALPNNDAPRTKYKAQSPKIRVPRTRTKDHKSYLPVNISRLRNQRLSMHQFHR